MSATPPDETSRDSMTTSRLRRLDDVLVPRLQRLARPVGRALGLPGRLLRGLDRRVAGGRPARAVQEHRGLVAFVVVVIAFGAAAVNFQRYPELREQARRATENQGAPAAPGDEVPGGGNDTTSTGTVGPVLSGDVEPYLASRREALAAAADDAERVAVVSFGAFIEPAEAAELVDGLTVQLVQYRLPERTPRPAEVEVAGGGVVEGVAAEIDRLVASLEEEEAEVASTLESGVEDPAFRADYEARLDELVALRNTLRSDPAIVFAVVVEGPVERLRELAAEDEVRLVDLAPPDASLEDTTFYGVLPTDQDRFTFGRQA